MDKLYAEKYHKLEENHWWFKGRRDIIYKLLKDYPRNMEVLDIGCSGCVLLVFLKNNGFTMLKGIDTDKEAVDICRQKGFSDIRIADAQDTGFKDQQFDVVIASDVLEHMKDDNKTLFEWHRILKTDGKLIIFVPAFRFLWGRHDDVNIHYRRYTKSDLIQVLKKNGFIVERSSYWNLSLFLPVSILRISQKLFLMYKKKQRDNLYEASHSINKALEYMLRFENNLLSKGINFIVGVSVFAIARKI